MFKKIIIILTISSFTAYPTVPVLAQELIAPSLSNENSNQNQEALTQEGLESPSDTGDFLNPDSDQAPAPDPTATPPAEKKEGTLIENPAGIAPTDNSDDVKKEEPPATDDPTMLPHQYTESVNGTVEKSKFNKANGEMAVDSFSGAVTYSYTFDLPPGRNGLEPSLKLNYNSQLKNFNNQGGLGWELNLIDIHRNQKYDNLNNTNYFIFNFYGDNQNLFAKDLASDGMHGEYISNSSDFSKIEFLPDNSWKVIDKNGVVYKLGSITDSRLYSLNYPTLPQLMTKWFVDEIRDTNDNYIKFEYYKDLEVIYPSTYPNNQIYPKKITYTGHGSVDGDIVINFQPFASGNLSGYERTDINTSYEYRLWQAPVITKYLVNKIEVVVNNELKKKYQLSYTAGDNSVMSLLTSIQEIGIENGQELARPATTFEYTIKQKDSGSFIDSGNWKAPNIIWSDFGGGVNLGGNVDFGTRLFDINGDGLIDVIKSGNNTYKDYLNGETRDAGYLNNGVNGWYEGGCIPSGFVGQYGEDLGVRVVDVNGDGLTDVVRSYKQQYQQPIKQTWINKGNCIFESTTDYQVPLLIVNELGQQNVDFADVNGDGFMDILGGYINNGKDGWINLGNWSIPPSGGDSPDIGRRIADVNGDGYPDILYNNNTYLNTGDGNWVITNKWQTPVDFVEMIPGQNQSYDLGTRVVDINGDGLADIVANSAIYLNDGIDSFDYNTNWSLPESFIVGSGHVDTGARLVDANGDNLIDVVVARYENYHDGYKKTWINQPAVPNILKSVNNGYGEENEFSYKTSANYLNAQNISSVTNQSAYTYATNPEEHQTGALKTGRVTNEEKWITFVKPDLSSVPVGDEVVSFRFTMQLFNTNQTPNLMIKKVLSGWDPQTITWSTQPDRGELLCQRNQLTENTWNFYCHGPLDDNGFAIETALEDQQISPYTNITNIQIYDLVYQTTDPYNPNQNLDSTVEVVNEIKTNDGINPADSLKDYKYNDGAKATSTSAHIMPLEINQSQLAPGGTEEFGISVIPKIAQSFKVSRTDDYNYAKVRLSRWWDTPNDDYINVYITPGLFDQPHQTYYPDENNILISAIIPNISIPYGYNLTNIEVNFPQSAHLEENSQPSQIPYFIVITPNEIGYQYFSGNNVQGSYNCISEFQPCSEYKFYNSSPPWDFWHIIEADLYFAIGIQSSNVTRQNHEFSGFGKVEVTDQDGYKNISYYHQGGGLDSSAIGEYEDSFTKRGRPFRMENYDTNGDLISQSINKWDAYDTFSTSTFAATSTFVYLDQTTDSLFNDSAEHKDTAKTYTYDFDNGNLLTETNKGEGTANIQTGEFTDDQGDEKLTTYNYATSDEELHILSAVKNKIISDPYTSDDLSQDYYYDGLSLGQVEHYNLTKEDLLLQPNIDYEYTYNDYGLVYLSEDPYDNVTTTTYDTYNMYPTTVINPLNQTIQYTYDLYTGQLSELIDPNGLVTQNVYDAFGRLTEVKTSDPANPTQLITRESYEYHDFVNQGEPWWIKHSVYSTTTSPINTYTYYDGFGRVVQERKETETANQFSVVSYKYNDRGNLEKQSLPYFENGSAYSAPNWSSVPKNEYTYDGLNRVLTVTNSLGTTSNSYDLWTTTITDANNKTKDLTKDAYDRLVEVKEHNGANTYTTDYNYNYLDKLTKITDTQNNQRNFSYDDLGRLTSQQEMHKATSTTYGTWSYQYDLNSNLTQKTDPKNQVVNYTYDELNRILTEDYTTTTPIDVSYVYDTGTNAIGRLTSVTRNTTPTVSTSYVYDILGRVATETKDIKGRVFNTFYTYDLLNNPLIITYPDNFEVNYGYNSAGQTESVSYKESGGNEIDVVDNVDYSPLNQISKINYTNGTETNNTYTANQLYRLTNKQTVKSGMNLQNISYAYDPVGNITQIVDTSPNQLAKTADYVYDDLYRLTTATITTSTVTTLTFSYDPIGNITNKSDLGNYTYANINPYQTNQINGVSQTYDNNGNLTNDTVRALTYDYQDRLTGSTINNRTTNYYYDHSKTRVAKYNARTGAFTEYPNKYFEKSNNKQDWYIFLGNQRLGVVEATSTTALYLNFTDHLNSSSITTDSQGNIINLIDYYPYGSERVNIQNQNFSPSYRFTDQEKDNESDQYYYDSRYYGQNTGRFNSIDLAVLYLAPQTVLDPQLLNYYSYSRDNPIRYYDPTGNVIIETNEENKTSMTIESGDTLSAISQLFDMDYQSLANKLGINDPDKINAGDKYDVTNIIALGSVFINLKNNYSVRVDPPSAGTTDRYNAHLYKNGKQLKEYSQDLFGNPREDKKDFGEKINKQLENNKIWNQKRELQERWDKDHKNDRNSGSSAGSGNDSGLSSGDSITSQGVNLFFLPVINAPMPLTFELPAIRLPIFNLRLLTL